MSNKGIVEVTISNIVRDLPEVGYEQALYEAITNAIQANANNIKINIISNSLDYHEKDNVKKYIDEIDIEDNGEGFIEKNIKAFKEYKTQNKIELGCKGIGRFLYLKVFDKVEIESLDKQIEFTTDKDIEVGHLSKKGNLTVVKLISPKTKIIANYEDLEKKIFEHFLAYFKLLKDRNKEIIITVFENNSQKFSISNKDLPDFESKEFKIKSHNFLMSYVFNNKELSKEGYFCADKRVVIKNSNLDSNKKIKFFKQFDFLFLLESKYFDNNVNETRDNFTIFPKQKKEGDLFGNISWQEIQNEVRNQIKIIAQTKGIDLDKIANDNLNRAIKKVPFLGFYLKENKDILNEEDLILEAKKRLEEDKKYIREHQDKEEAKYHQKLSIVTQSELAEYIFDREKVIKKLKQLTDEKSLEKEIHDLFMKRNSMDETNSYRTNHLWLFDDRFMTYDKVFSDKQIKDIFPKLSEKLERPDLLSIVSNTYDKESMTDVVVIELKRPDEKITPARAEEQLLDYANFINENFKDKKMRIWTYAFLKFDNDVERRLTSKGYNRVFTKAEYPLYYKPYPEENTIINFIDYKTIAYDAELRNKTFLNILKGTSFSGELNE